MVRDIDLRDRIAGLPSEPWSGVVYRTCWQGSAVLRGSSGGGRWCPHNAFEVLYTSLEKGGALAKIDAWLRNITPRPDRPIEVHTIEVETHSTVTIGDLDALAVLGVDIERFDESDYDRTQQIGDAAHFLGRDALVVPSARWQCLNLVLFPDNHGDMPLTSVRSEIVDWDRWRAERGP